MTWGNPPLATFGDELAAGRDYLQAALERPSLVGRPDVQGARVGLFLPGGYVPADGPPFVRLSRDGTPSATYPIVAARTLRVVVWHTGPTHARSLAELCLALLLTHPGGQVLAGCSFLTGVQPATDPDNGGDIAAFTVRARVGAQVI